MWAYFARRFLLAVPTLLFASFVVFLIIQYTPGGPVEHVRARPVDEHP